jgi:hypothetical protein
MFTGTQHRESGIGLYRWPIVGKEKKKRQKKKQHILNRDRWIVVER